MVEEDKILVVDDEPALRELLIEMLHEIGYKAEAVSDGMAALERLRDDDRFVLLLTDIMMPQMDGIELIREAHTISPSLISVVMTGFGTLDTARAALKEGAYDYVLKPFTFEEIKIAVSNAFERHHLANENARLLELTGLFNISESIAGIHDERLLLDFVLRAALDRVAALRGSILLVRPDGKALEVAVSVGLPEKAKQELVEMDSSISGWVASHMRPLLVTDLSQEPDLQEISLQHQDTSFISVPLERKPTPERNRRRGHGNEPEAIAVLNVSAKRDGTPFNEGDLKTLSIVANHTAAALDNVRLLRHVERAHLATLQSMALLLEAKDPYTHGHSQRVGEISVQLAKALGLSDREVDTLRVGAEFHDIGKVGVPDGILDKREPLTDDEWEMIRRHPVIGYQILEPVSFLAKGHRDIVRGHHERIDGSGYPDGLSDERVSALVRVIAVADAYDAMSSDRAYRKALPREKILEELTRCAGEHLDEEVTRVLIEMLENGTLVLPEQE